MLHYLNGNIKLTNIKIAHFNKGNSKFKNKLDDIHYIIDSHTPLIFSISEANYCNMKLTNIKIAHFNKGNSKFENKLDDIYYIIDTLKPLIFFHI